MRISLEELSTKPYGDACPPTPRCPAEDSPNWENWDYKESGGPPRDLDIDEDYLPDEDFDEIGPRRRST